MAGEQPSDCSTLLQNVEQLARLSVALAALSTEALKANVRHYALLCADVTVQRRFELVVA